MIISSFEFFIYGMCVMFYSMMTWMFWRKGSDNLSRLIMWIMLLQDIECFKDLMFSTDIASAVFSWHIITALDMVIIPLYVFVLMELCKPGWFSLRRFVIHEIPFVLLPILFVCSDNSLWFYLLMAWGGIYGTATLVLTFFLISRYHKQLKERFSYQENINLNWLRGILITFWVILLVWTFGGILSNVFADDAYMLSSLALWIVVCYFLYKHETVIDELKEDETVGEIGEMSDEPKEYALPKELKEKLQQAFDVDKLYLNPRLKLSDIASRVGTNRTYISRFFNKDNGQTFYDYVNSLRVKHAEHLLRTTSLPISTIAEQSGFTSMSTFRRAFADYHDCSPTGYRKADS